MEYVFRIVKVHYWQPYRLSPLTMSWPPFGLPTQKSWRRRCCHRQKSWLDVIRWSITVNAVGIDNSSDKCRVFHQCADRNAIC